jgi:glycerophosphoryl diester phosphodiesterase
MKITKIAFRADVVISLHRALQIVKDEECTDVYIIGDNPERVAQLRAAGLTVHQVATREELPADVFYFFLHKGVWAVMHTETDSLRDVGISFDSIMANRVLLNRFAPEYAKQFHVVPVSVELLDGY